MMRPLERERREGQHTLSFYLSAPNVLYHFPPLEKREKAIEMLALHVLFDQMLLLVCSCWFQMDILQSDPR